MPTLIVANRKKLLLSVALCCVPYAVFGMEEFDDKKLETESQFVGDARTKKPRSKSVIGKVKRLVGNSSSQSNASGTEEEYESEGKPQDKKKTKGSRRNSLSSQSEYSESETSGAEEKVGKKDRSIIGRIRANSLSKISKADQKSSETKEDQLQIHSIPNSDPPNGQPDSSSSPTLQELLLPSQLSGFGADKNSFKSLGDPVQGGNTQHSSESESERDGGTATARGDSVPRRRPTAPSLRRPPSERFENPMSSSSNGASTDTPSGSPQRRQSLARRDVSVSRDSKDRRSREKVVSRKVSPVALELALKTLNEGFPELEEVANSSIHENNSAEISAPLLMSQQREASLNPRSPILSSKARDETQEWVDLTDLLQAEEALSKMSSGSPKVNDNQTRQQPLPSLPAPFTNMSSSTTTSSAQSVVSIKDVHGPISKFIYNTEDSDSEIIFSDFETTPVKGNQGQGTNSIYRGSVYNPRMYQLGRPRELSLDSANSNNSQTVLPEPFQRIFMSEENPYLQPQNQSSSKNGKNLIEDLLTPTIEKTNEYIGNRFFSMKDFCLGKSTRPLESLGLAFYTETTNDNITTWPKQSRENIDNIKPERLIDVFWDYKISSNSLLQGYLNHINEHTLELIASSAVFLIHNMSGLDFKPAMKNEYIKNLCIVFSRFGRELMKRFPNVEKYKKYYSYYSAKYLTMDKQYEAAWPHLVTCDDFSECIEGYYGEKDFYKQELTWIKHLKNYYLWVILPNSNENALTKSKRYLEIARVVEKINIIENNNSIYPEEINDSIDLEAANHYLESAKHSFEENQMEILKEIKTLDMLFHLARKAESLLVLDHKDSYDLLEKVFRACDKHVFDAYLKRAEVGGGAELFDLGWMYENGYGVEQNFDLAALCYMRADELDNPEAQYSLGVMYQNGEGVEQSYELAAQYYEKAANQGDVEAQYNFALFLEKGCGVTQDFELAARYFTEAARLGHLKAMVCLGQMYVEGRGVKQDDKKAAECYKFPAEAGDAIAQIRYSLMLKDGRGVSINPKEAMKWCKKSADQGNAEGQYHLGWMYLNSYTGERDRKEGISLYKQSAKQEYAEAQFELGLLYAAGGPVPKKPEKAIRYYALAAHQAHEEAIKKYKKIAEGGHPEAQADLGRMYEEGVGVEENLDEALKWYRLALNNGSVMAKFCLGLMYVEGRGVETDIKTGLGYMEEAASQGDSEMQLSLGIIYEGKVYSDIPESLKQAKKWYQAAAEGESAEARYKLGMILSKEKNFMSAFKHFKDAAEQGHADAQYNIGWMYANGRAGELNFKEAYRYYLLAADQGHRGAQFNLGAMYANGSGVEKDDNKANICFEAATEGNPNLKRELAKMYEEGEKLPKDLAKAKEWYDLAAEDENLITQ